MVARNRKIVVGVLLLIAVVIGIYLVMGEKLTDERQSAPSIELSAWVVDWQLESGQQDLANVIQHLHSVQLFAAYYDWEDQLHYTNAYLERFDSFVAALHLNDGSEGGGVPPLYLTVVNDVWHADGTATQKDPALIERIVQSKESRHHHIDQLIRAVSGDEFAGLELDYERIPADAWDGYAAFIRELYDQLKDQGRSLRVVLEPRVLSEKFTLPEGPQYAVMAYNLFGTHSGPGPKANDDFLQQLASRMANLPGDDAVVALATGGFDWSESGSVKSVTEKQGEQLAGEYEVHLTRDEGSGALTYNYVDEHGVAHTVWYADGQTLSQWVRTLADAGYAKIAIWRLGEIGDSTLQSFFHDPLGG